MELASKGFSHSIWFTNTNSTYTYLRLRLLRRGKGHAHIIKHTGSRLRKRLLLKRADLRLGDPPEFEKL